MTKIDSNRIKNRAREICARTGLDPDFIMLNGVGDEAPAWVSKRDEARKELEEEHRIANAKDRVTGQPEKYRNNHFVVCGEYVQPTIDQMITCIRFQGRALLRVPSVLTATSDMRSLSLSAGCGLNTAANR